MRIVDDLRGDTCFFQHFGKATQTKLVRQAVGAVAQIDNVTVAELQQMLCCHSRPGQPIYQSIQMPNRNIMSQQAWYSIMLTRSSPRSSSRRA